MTLDSTETPLVLVQENLVGAKTAPTAISRTFTPLARETRFSLVRIHKDPQPESHGKSADGGDRWSNPDPDASSVYEDAALLLTIGSFLLTVELFAYN